MLSLPLNAGLTRSYITSCLAFLCEVWRWKSGPCACKASTLLTEPFSQPAFRTRSHTDVRECRSAADRLRALLTELDRTSWLVCSLTPIAFVDSAFDGDN